MLVNNKYNLGEIVYLVDDLWQVPRQVVDIIISIEDTIRYILTDGETQSMHFESVISSEKVLIKKY